MGEGTRGVYFRLALWVPANLNDAMLPLPLAGGAFLGAMTQTTMTQPKVELYNHTLRGERILASEVVCRNRWGTPMLPDGTGGYSLTAPINQEYIAQSLIQPPLTGGPVFRPRPVVPPAP